MKTFRVTEDHIKLLQRFYVGWSRCEYGAPEINPKRPYGNSSVDIDIASILGWSIPDEEQLPWEEYEQQRDSLHVKARAIHLETQAALQILLLNCRDGIKPGMYAMQCEYSDRSWYRIGD